MAIGTYAELQTAVANFLNRSDLTSRIPEFISLAEARILVDCKLLEFETTATVAFTSGIGALPTGFLSMRSAYWDDTQDTPMLYVPPEIFDAWPEDTGTPARYTITGANVIKVKPLATGNAKLTYTARFSPLSSTSTSALLTNFPDVYLYGSLMHASIYVEDDAKTQKYGLLFNAALERVASNDAQRKYGNALVVRAR